MFDAKRILDLITSGQFGAGGDALAANANDALQRGRAAAEQAGASVQQATSGVADQTASAISDVLGKAQDQFKDTAASDYIAKAKELVEQNPGGTLATLGGLAALLLGTPGGRKTTGGLIQVGGLAAIGGLAYKAFRNYQEGKPLTAGVPGLDQLGAPPAESPFSADAHTNETATLLLRTLVAVAAADGTVDQAERAQIIGQLKAAGMEEEAAQFIDAEIKSPASAQEIAREVGSSKELALQVYAAAHLVADSAPEKAFLARLAQALALDPQLVAHIDATAASLTPPAA